MRTDESGVKTGDSNEKRLILFTLKKEMTRFNETRFSVVEEQKRGQITGQRQEIELSTVTDNAEKAKGKRPGFH